MKPKLASRTLPRSWLSVRRPHPSTMSSLWTAVLASCILACGVEPTGNAADISLEEQSSSPCVANNDGEITRNELPFRTGVSARFRIERGEIPISTQGRTEKGVIVWDFSRPEPNEQPLALLTSSEVQSKWFSDHFPHAEIAGPLTAESDLWGPISTSDEGVFLHGGASDVSLEQENPTLLVYDEPVVLYPFPLRKEAHVQSEAVARNAILQGIPVALRDFYDVEVTDIGTLILPDLILENTLRVTVRFERILTVGDVRQVSHIFVHECLGEVARIVSPAVPMDQSVEDEFPFAIEVRRMSL